MENESHIWDYLEEFSKALRNQLMEDELRWGDTWMKRPKEGQEERIRHIFENYFDQFENAGIPINWLKVAGNALIAWVRDNYSKEK